MFKTIVAAASAVLALGAGIQAHAEAGLTDSVFHNILPYTTPGVGYSPNDASIDMERAYTQSVNADYSFINTADTFTYSGGQGTPTNGYLGGDAAGAALTDTADVYDTAFDAKGTISVSEAGAYTFSIPYADDAARLYVGGATVAEQTFNGPLSGTPASVTLNLSSPESFELFMYETVNGANLALNVTGPGVVSYTTAVSAAPEPSTWALMIAGVGLAGAALRFGRRSGSPATA